MNETVVDLSVLWPFYPPAPDDFAISACDKELLIPNLHQLKRTPQNRGTWSQLGLEPDMAKMEE